MQWTCNIHLFTIYFKTIIKLLSGSFSSNSKMESNKMIKGDFSCTKNICYSEDSYKQPKLKSILKDWTLLILLDW